MRLFGGLLPNGFGLLYQSRIQLRMSASRAPTLLCTSQRVRWSVRATTTPLTRLPAAEARIFLRAAAAAARTSSRPRPDQFLHIKSISVRDKHVTNREVWKSVDGSRASYSSSGPAAYFLGCKDGKYVGPDGAPEAHENWDGTTCTPQPGYRSDLPNTLAGMRHLLRTKGLPELVMDVFMQPTPNLLPAETEAVLFEALAELPEVSLVQPVTDAAGRQGVAVSWDQHGSTLRLVFDPIDHSYRSVQIIEPGDQVPGMEDALVGYEIVDAIPPQ
jgi:hypothetical protein